VYCVHNILCRLKERSIDKIDENLMDVKLIDYESLECWDDITKNITFQDHAISPGSFDQTAVSCFVFLFWQVLWMAHACFVNCGNPPPKYSIMKLKTEDFVKFLFTEDGEEGVDSRKQFDPFISWLGRSYQDLKNTRENLLASKNDKAYSMACITATLSKINDLY
jgi:hypothetical protein